MAQKATEVQSLLVPLKKRLQHLKMLEPLVFGPPVIGLPNMACIHVKTERDTKETFVQQEVQHTHRIVQEAQEAEFKDAEDYLISLWLSSPGRAPRFKEEYLGGLASMLPGVNGIWKEVSDYLENCSRSGGTPRGKLGEQVTTDGQSSTF